MQDGRVNTHARRILVTVFPWMPDLFATIVPATPLLRTCVVLTGRPVAAEIRIVEAAIVSAAAPWAYVRCCLPIFSATVFTIRLYPIVVPMPRASAVPITTHSGT